jgi:hypothetical protein
MRCSACRRKDRAIFARLFSGGKYLLLCGACLDHINGQIQHRLQSGSPPPLRYTKLVCQPYRRRHLWSRLTDSFTVPVRMLVNRCKPVLRTS